jgi:hypothetical protein
VLADQHSWAEQHLSGIESMVFIPGASESNCIIISRVSIAVKDSVVAVMTRTLLTNYVIVSSKKHEDI